MIERYSRPEMAELWSLKNRYEAWLRVEIAVCEAWCEKGRIDPGFLYVRGRTSMAAFQS